MLHADLSSQKDREQFIQEARLLKKLNEHPHILPIIDAGIQDGTPYLITEYASLGSLRDLIDQHLGRPLSLENALTILSQIGQALYFAHQNKIVHCDLKPDNILFNAQGEALLADFGIAVILKTPKTKQLGLGGTPSYMAPEQFEGLVSLKSDQYALGCVAYELFTGQKPFITSRPSLENIWYQHAKVEPIPPTQLNQHLPSYIDALTKSSDLWLDKNDGDYEAITVNHQPLNADPNKTTEADHVVFMKPNPIHSMEDLHPKKPQESSPVSGAVTQYRFLNTFKNIVISIRKIFQELRLSLKTKRSWLKEGDSFTNSKRYEEALAAYEQAIRLDPIDPFAYCRKGWILCELKRPEEALAACEQAIHLDPEYSYGYFEKAYALGKIKRYKEALAACQQALRLDPENSYAHSNKGYALNGLKRYKEALAACEGAINLDPENSTAHSTKGHALNELKRYKEALAACQQALRLDPEDVETLNNISFALNKLDRYEEALDACEQVIHLDTNNANAYVNKAHALSNLKRYKEAVAAFEKANKLA